MAWWFAIPVVIGAGKLIYDAVTDDDSSSDRYEREREAQQRAKEAKNKEIRKEIREYKNKQIVQIKKKYGVEIILKKSKVKIMSQDKTQQYEIDDLKKESTELEEAIKELEDIKNKTFK